MAVFMVSYDLRQPTRNYQPLYTRLAEWKAIRCLESLWFVNWDTDSVKLRDDLAAHIDGNDGLIVAKLSSQAAWKGLIGTTGDTLKAWLES